MTSFSPKPFRLGQMYSANAPMVPRHTMPVRRFFFSVELAPDWALKLSYPWHLLDADHYDLNASHAWDIAQQLGDWEMLLARANKVGSRIACVERCSGLGLGSWKLVVDVWVKLGILRCLEFFFLMFVCEPESSNLRIFSGRNCVKYKMLQGLALLLHSSSRLRKLLLCSRDTRDTSHLRSFEELKMHTHTHFWHGLTLWWPATFYEV